MEPYIERYTSEGLKFLALKLLDTADVKDLSPFRFTLPGTTPTIPLRMTALAAEPEMSILTFVLASERFEGKNWANVEIPDDQIRYNPTSYYATTVSTNWPRLVAQAVDEADGQGWVTEFAGPSANYTELLRNQVQNGNFATPEDGEAAADLLAAFEAYPYLTRLYTRVSAEEMTSDPVFGRTTLGNVAREHQLSRFVNGVDQCGEDARASTDPCDFATCGAGGMCRRVSLSDGAASAMGMSAEIVAPGCACLPGATARATFAPDGSPTVICQDGRMSFLNAGDRDEQTGEVLPDACAGFDCGDHGQCTAMNMTPTCVCDRGFVAVGSIDPNGARRTRCEEPSETVPSDFYEKRLPLLPRDLPGGREVMVPATMPPVVTPPDVAEPAPGGGFPMPRENPDFGGSGTPNPMASGGDGGCAMSPGTVAPDAAQAPWLLAGLLAAAGARRRRSRPGS
jgi:MYXO-CTERM domain-containing protein